MLQKLSFLCLVVTFLGIIVWSTHASTHEYPAVLDRHLQEISRQTHPLGSAEIEKVRGYILEQIPEAYAVEQQEFAVEGVELVNILAYLDRGGGVTEVVSVHYDSALGSYGAGDIGTGVASALTLLPEWTESGASTNLLVAFVDGEEGLVYADGEPTSDAAVADAATTVESGAFLLGSRYFVDTYDGRYGEIARIYNFEGRGTGGRLTLFETVNLEDAEVVAWNNRLGTLTFSVSEEVLKLLPNDTDVTEYRRLETPKILNVAYVGEGENYHTPNDTFENVDYVSKADTYTAMRRMVGGEIEASAQGVRAVYASTGLWTLSTPRWVVQVGAWLSLVYLLTSHFRRANPWLLGPILALLSVLVLEFTYLSVWSGILFAAVYRYRTLCGSFYARAIVLAGSLGLWYSFVVVMGWLEGFGSLSFVILLSTLAVTQCVYYQALSTVEARM